MKYLIEEANANINELDINGESCLFYAGKSSNVIKNKFFRNLKNGKQNKYTLKK